jgi:predicted permease
MLVWADLVNSTDYAGTAIAPLRSAMRASFRDLRFAARVLQSSPAFTAITVLTLGLGMACTTTVFSWVDSVLLHPYPGAGAADDLAAFEMIKPSSPNGGTAASWLDYRDYRDNLRTLAGLAWSRHGAFTLGDDLPGRLTWGQLVSANFFDVMRVKPVLGRFFHPAEEGDRLGAYPVVVISERLWRSYFRSDPGVVGRSIRLNRRPMTIVGVAPAEFRGSSPVLLYEIWAPITMGPTLGMLAPTTFTERDDRGGTQMTCRLRPGVRIEQARAEAAAFAARLAEMYPKTNRGIGATVLPTWEEHNGVNEYLRRPLIILLAVSLVVLLIVCANVANLLLARSVSRQREFAIRCAIGAGRSRVAIQVMTETLVLAAAGAGVGLLLLLWLQGSLTAMIPSIGLPIGGSLIMNGRILAFTALACLSATLVSGVSPALFVLRTNLNGVLQEGGRGETAGATSRRTRTLLAAGEVALATVALVGAGLFVRSFRNVRAIHPGFEPRHVLLGRFFIETAGFSSDQARQFSARLKERLLATPGVEAVSYSDFVPLSSTGGPYSSVRVDGYTPVQGESTGTNRAAVSPDYFASMRIPLLSGRDFTDADDEKTEPVMIVNQALAARYFHGEDPVGHKVRTLQKWWTVVGMVRDSKQFSPAEPPRPFFYLPFRQAYSPGAELYFLTRTTGPPEDATAAFRRAVIETDRSAFAVHMVPLAEYTEVATIGQKVAATLMAALGLMCLLLAGSGIYGVMSYSVNQRLGEIAIRMAMGATPLRVIGMVVAQGMMVAIGGLAAGVGAALAVTRLVRSMLVGIGATDPASFLIAAGFLLTVALLSTWLPAWRATRGDPMGALRR